MTGTTTLRFRPFFVSLWLFAAAFPALAQQYPPVPGQTVIGRASTSSGPSQAIPFSVLGANLLANGLVSSVPASLVSATVSSGGSGCPANSTFNVTTTGGTIGTLGSQAIIRVSTNGSGVVTSVNSIVSAGSWPVVPNTPNAVAGSSCFVAPKLNLVYTGGNAGNAVIIGVNQSQIIDAGAPPVLNTRNINTTSPIIGGGALSSDLTLSFGTQNANSVLAGPSSGSPAAPGFRALVGTDLPLPGSSSLGGVQSITSLAHNWIAYIDTLGVPHQSQPAFSDISGTFTAAQCVAATGSALGCVKPDGTTITVSSGVITAVGGTATNVDAGGATTVTNCGTSNAFLENTGSSKVGCVAGPWTLLATLTASNSATLSDTTHITSTYTDYEIVFENLIPATASVTAEFQVHTGGAFQTTGYSGQTFLPNGTAISNNTWSTFAFLSTVNGVDNIAPGVNARLFFTNPAAGGVHAIYGQAVNASGAGPIGALTIIGGFWQSSSGLDGFQFLFSSGTNITSGVIKIYGRL